jgi:predicted AAA+ superfamily ATPase
LRQNFIILTIFKDILSVYSVREPKALENLILLIADKQCLPLNYYSISKIIGINKETVSNYFRYLESAHLIIEASYYARNTTKKITKEKKYYIADTGLRNALMGESILKDDILSTDIEGAVAQHLINLQARMDARLFYWNYGVILASVSIKLNSHLLISASGTSLYSSSTSTTKSRRISDLFTSDLTKGCCGNFRINCLAF